MIRQVVDVHLYLPNRGVALRVSLVAPMRLNQEFESFTRLPRNNVTESVGVAGSATNDSELLVIESGALSLQKCAPAIKGTQRYGELFIVEQANNSHGAIGLQKVSIVDNAESHPLSTLLATWSVRVLAGLWRRLTSARVRCCMVESEVVVEEQIGPYSLVLYLICHSSIIEIVNAETALDVEFRSCQDPVIVFTSQWGHAHANRIRNSIGSTPLEHGYVIGA